MPLFAYLFIWIVSIFWLLWIVLLRTWAHRYLFEPLLSVLWGYILEVELLDCGNSILNFSRKQCIDHRGSSTFYISTSNVHKGSSFSTSSPTLVIYCFCCCFNNNQPNECEEVFHCNFDVHFSNDWWCWTSFHVLTGHLYIFFAFCFFDGIVCSMIVRSLAEIHIAYVSSCFLVNILLTVKKRGKINTLQIRSCLLIAQCTWYSFWGWNTEVNKI